MAKSTKEQTLEEEFVSLKEETLGKIKIQIDIARTALEKAESISEKFGIPFTANISRSETVYIPLTFADLHSHLNKDWLDTINNLPKTQDEYEDDSGWSCSF